MPTTVAFALPAESKTLSLKSDFQLDPGHPNFSLPRIEKIKEKPKAVVTEKKIEKPIIFPEQLVKNICLKGVTVFSEKELEPLYKNYLGKKLNKEDLAKIIIAIDSYYAQKGYILSKCSYNLHITKDCLYITVYEGSINNVQLVGTDDDSKFLNKVIHKIKEAKPFNIDKFNNFQNIMSDLDGMTIFPIFKPAVGTKSTPLDHDVFFINQRKTMAGKIYFDNRNSLKTHGNQGLQGILDISFYNLLKFDETLKLNASSTGDIANYKLLSGSLKMPINSNGLTLNVAGQYYDFKPDLTELNASNNIADFARNFKIFSGITPDVNVENPLSNKEKSLSIGLNYPIYQKDKNQFNIYSNFNVDQSIQSYNLSTSAAEPTKTTSNSIEAGINTTLYHNSGISFALITFAQRINGLLTKTNIANPSFELDSSKVTFTLLRRQELVGNTYFVATVNGQYTPSSLLSTDKISAGGRYVGKGFKTNYLNGDKGLTASLYLYHNNFNKKIPFLPVVNYYGFVDAGITKNNRSLSLKESNSFTLIKQKMVSAGIGANLYFTNNFIFNIEIVKPLYAGNKYDNHINRNKKINVKKPKLFFGGEYKFEF